MKTQWVAIQMKATELYVHVVLFIMLYKVVQLSSLWMKSSWVAIQTKVTVQYFHDMLPVSHFTKLNLKFPFPRF